MEFVQYQGTFHEHLVKSLRDESATYRTAEIITLLILIPAALIFTYIRKCRKTKLRIDYDFVLRKLTFLMVLPCIIKIAPSFGRVVESAGSFLINNTFT